MKQVGIITFHNSYNCGSMLQAYALQTFIINNGITCEIIDFSNDGQRKVYSIYDKNKSIKAIIKNILISLCKNRMIMNNNSYEEFKSTYFKLSREKFFSADELTDSEYEIIIAGSDQIWNITIEDGDDAYFLPWVKNARKVAYAPSFGARNIVEYSTDPDKYIEYLNSFELLSIREDNGQKWINDIISKVVPVVLDPTLLLNTVDYDKIALESPNLPETFIFYYSPGYVKSINNLVSKISKKYHLPVIVFNTRSYYYKRMFLSGFMLPEIENPRMFLQLIKKAKLVITTSFHGTIFSSLYKKCFWVIKNGEMYNSDDRILTLLKNLDLEDRLISDSFDNDFNYLKDKYFQKYDSLLQEKKIISQRFLLNAIKGNEK